MSFRLVPKSVILNDLERCNGRYFSEFAYLPGVLRKSSRSLSHLLMSSFCIAYCRMSSTHVLTPKNCSFAWGHLNPHLIHGTLSPPEHTTQMASQAVQLFCTAYSRVLLGMPGHVLYPKNCPFT